MSGTAIPSISDLNAAEPKKLPNIVFIVSDDHGWTDYGFMGHATIQTPTLDQLARDSLVFRRGYVPSSLCRASLASMLTGLYPHQHKITSNDPPLPVGKRGADANGDATFLAQRQAMIANIDRVSTLPARLSDIGYVSLQTGKWWEGDFHRGGFTHGMSVGGRHGDKGLEIGRTTMQPIYTFIEQAVATEKPFFVWYAPMLPHSPHNPPERLLAKYRDQAGTLEIAKYWAMVEWFDETCAQLLEFLQRKGLNENTLVVYIADNGWIQDPDRDRYGPRSKQSPYDGGLRTLIMLRSPATIAPGENQHLASSIDLVPTVLAAVGLPLEAELPGIDLLDNQALSKRESIFGECFTHNAVDIDQPSSSLRFRWSISGNLKLIVPSPSNEPTAIVELFDLVQDPLETRNLADVQPKDVVRMSKQLDGWWSPFGS